jgi:hypothetical protein
VKKYLEEIGGSICDSSLEYIRRRVVGATNLNNTTGESMNRLFSSLLAIGTLGTTPTVHADTQATPLPSPPPILEEVRNEASATYKGVKTEAKDALEKSGREVDVLKSKVAKTEAAQAAKKAVDTASEYVKDGVNAVKDGVTTGAEVTKQAIRDGAEKANEVAAKHGVE